jgi:hypothetical protein
MLHYTYIVCLFKNDVHANTKKLHKSGNYSEIKLQQRVDYQGRTL